MTVNSDQPQPAPIAPLPILKGHTIPLIISLILAVLVSQLMHYQLTEERHRQGHSLADYLASVAAKPLNEENFDQLKMLASHQTSPNLLAILIYQRKNSQIVAGTPPMIDHLSAEGSLNFVSRITDPADKAQAIGQIEVIMTNKDISHSTVQAFFTVFLVSLALSYLLIYLQRRFGKVPAPETAAQPQTTSTSDIPLATEATPASLVTRTQPDRKTVIEANTASPQQETVSWDANSIQPEQASDPVNTAQNLDEDSHEALPDISDATILIVDDDKANRLVLRRSLQDNFRLLEAENGQDCLKILETQMVDLVLLDLMMPVMSGFEVLKYIQEHPEKSFPGIIVLSALMDSQTISNVLSMGASDYLTKPFNMEEMLARVNTQLSLERREMALERIVSKRTAQLQQANKRLEETFQQLLQSEKMASIGQLAAGVAHEINNPIGFIFSNLNSLKDYMKDVGSILHKFEQLHEAIEQQSPDVEMRLGELRQMSEDMDISFLLADIPELIADTLDGTERVKNIVANLKQFSRADDETVDEADINAGIESTLKVVWNELKYKCDIHRDFGDLPSTLCNINQLNQVFTNLLVNAAHAIDTKGEINIKTRQVGEMIEISIADNGKGIPPENIAKLFDPFFTTKPVGQGTGLGLYLSYEIIQKHKGHIKVDSEPGKGTTFTIQIPVSHAA